MLVKTWSPRRTVSVHSLYVKHQTRPPPPGHVSYSVCFTRCSQAAVHWSARTIQRSAKVTRPCMERVGLQPASYIQAAAYRTISRYRDMKCHDISISLLGYDMITSIGPHSSYTLFCIFHYISSIWCCWYTVIHIPYTDNTITTDVRILLLLLRYYVYISLCLLLSAYMSGSSHAFYLGLVPDL